MLFSLLRQPLQKNSLKTTRKLRSGTLGQAGDDEETVFDLLRIWIAGNQRLFSSKEAGELLLQLGMRSFWEHRHQRDLLLTLESDGTTFQGQLEDVSNVSCCRDHHLGIGREKDVY